MAGAEEQVGQEGDPGRHETLKLAFPPAKPPLAIDLFAGCGGLTMGLKQAGFRVIAAVEANAGAASGYRMNHPEVAHLYEQDVRQVKGTQILADLQLASEALDLLAGCPPCQGFSRMRTLNKGTASKDARNDLVYEYLRLVRELRPRALLMENVPGLRFDSRYQQLTAELRTLGYRVSDAIQDAADHGVPQRRRRLILLAGLGIDVSVPSATSANRLTVRDAIEGLPEPGTSGDPAQDVTETRSKAVRELISLIPRDGGSRRDIGEQYQLECHRNCDGFYDVYGRVSWDNVSPTITSGFVNPSKGRFLHPEQDRCLTPREAALLQTFPSSYKFPMNLGKYPVATMIGNALPPELARRHGHAVLTALNYNCSGRVAAPGAG